MNDKVVKYFENSMKRVWIDRGNIALGIETFQEYLEHRYKDNCYYYSAYALYGLNPDDRLLRGNIDVRQNGCSNYHHGWVEFKFEGEEYVFDPLLKSIIEKDWYYKDFKPSIDYEKTQKEILDKYLNEKYAFQISEDFWQFRGVVYENYHDYNQYFDYEQADREDGHVPSSLSAARVEVSKYTGRVLRFLAYDHPGG